MPRVPRRRGTGAGSPAPNGVAVAVAGAGQPPERATGNASAGVGGEVLAGTGAMAMDAGTRGEDGQRRGEDGQRRGERVKPVVVGGGAAADEAEADEGADASTVRGEPVFVGTTPDGQSAGANAEQSFLATANASEARHRRQSSHLASDEQHGGGAGVPADGGAKGLRAAVGDGSRERSGRDAAAGVLLRRRSFLRPPTSSWYNGNGGT